MNFKVKLNDEFLESDEPLSARGKVMTGITVKPTKKLQKVQEELEALKPVQNYVFATHKKLKLGPGDYNQKYSQTK